jgi:hypothetical protein
VPRAPDAGVCSWFAQQCKVTADCCDGVPCLGPGVLTPCMTGQTNCTCKLQIP